MANFLNRLLAAARRFSLFDFALFKLSLLSIGILLGTYFNEFFLRLLPAVWILAVFCTIAIVAITLTHVLGKKAKRKKKR